MMQLNTLSVALFNQIVQVGLTHVAYAANFLHCYSIYIGELNISLSQVYNPFVYIILCLLWIRFLPYQKSCNKTSVFYLERWMLTMNYYKFEKNKKTASAFIG